MPCRSQKGTGTFIRRDVNRMAMNIGRMPKMKRINTHEGCQPNFFGRITVAASPHRIQIGGRFPALASWRLKMQLVMWPT